jgi:hypothetical protein
MGQTAHLVATRGAERRVETRMLRTRSGSERQSTRSQYDGTRFGVYAVPGWRST